MLDAQRYSLIECVDDNGERSDLNSVADCKNVAFFGTEKPAVERKDIRAGEVREDIMRIMKSNSGVDTGDGDVVQHHVAGFQTSDKDAVLVERARQCR